jgi:hypothetical protein
MRAIGSLMTIFQLVSGYENHEICCRRDVSKTSAPRAMPAC